MRNTDGTWDRFEIVKSLVGGAITGGCHKENEGEENEETVWEFTYHDGQTPPTDAEITTEEARLEAEWDTQAYSRNRRNEYPELHLQLEKIYDDGLTKWKSEMVDPVKTKWPKDNSGPVE